MVDFHDRRNHETVSLPPKGVAWLPLNWHSMGSSEKEDWNTYGATMAERDEEMRRRGGNW